ncbi:MAG: precorrin-6A reductase [Candidatus Scalindua sp.]|jgi:precorrin-6A/cobalt-precorrin-6A reductase|nr:precorrin-6A reductase [Candidatus Scalindua sp.]
MSGTEEGREIVERLNDKGEDVVTTVATEYGREIYKKKGLGHLCIQGRLDTNELSELIRNKNIDTLIDATHPYATQASLNAIKASEESSIKYIRFQRSTSVTEGGDIGKSDTDKLGYVHLVEDMDEAVSWCSKSDRKRILLTTGFSAAEKFVKLKDEKEIFVRILPMPAHIEQCVNMGIKPSNVLALQGPFTIELNTAIYNQYKIDVVVTKDSGKTGGVPEKIQSASEAEIDIVIIKRDEIEYPVKCSSIDEVFDLMGKG